jgi:hypothetical protein
MLVAAYYAISYEIGCGWQHQQALQSAQQTMAS